MNKIQKIVIALTLGLLAIVSVDFLNPYPFGGEFTPGRVSYFLTNFLVRIFMPVLLSGGAIFVLTSLKKGGD